MMQKASDSCYCQDKEEGGDVAGLVRIHHGQSQTQITALNHCVESSWLFVRLLVALSAFELKEQFEFGGFGNIYVK